METRRNCRRGENRIAEEERGEESRGTGVGGLGGENGHGTGVRWGSHNFLHSLQTWNKWESITQKQRGRSRYHECVLDTGTGKSRVSSYWGGLEHVDLDVVQIRFKVD